MNRPKPSTLATLAASPVTWLVVLVLLFSLAGPAQAKSYGAIEQQRIDKIFPQTDAISAAEGKFKVRTLSASWVWVIPYRPIMARISMATRLFRLVAGPACCAVIARIRFREPIGGQATTRP